MSLISNPSSKKPRNSQKPAPAFLPAPAELPLNKWVHPASFLLDNLADAVISFDIDYKIRSWNKKAEEIYGASETDVIGRPVNEILFHEFLTDTRESAWKKLKKSGKWKGEVLHIGKDGDLIQNVPGVVYQWEENYDGSFGFTYLSPKVEEYFGIRPEEMNTPPGLIHPDDQKRFRESIDEANQTEKPWEFEGRLLYPDGNIKWWRGSSVMSVKTEKGRIYNGIIFDITARKSQEKKREEEEGEKKREIIKAIMEAQEKERREISSELHDNVNQILTTCKLFLEIARNNPADARFIDVCYLNIQNVIQEIRNISHNLTPYTLKDLGLVATIRDIVEKINQSGKLLIRLVAFQNLEEEKVSPDIKLTLFRIIQEKISNVLKHSQATELKISINLYDGRVYLLLTDNGQGFDENAVKKGLGLNNIRNRVEYYKGALVLKTAPGQGCELAIELPCA